MRKPKILTSPDLKTCIISLLGSISGRVFVDGPSKILKIPALNNFDIASENQFPWDACIIYRKLGKNQVENKKILDWYIEKTKNNGLIISIDYSIIREGNSTLFHRFADKTGLTINASVISELFMHSSLLKPSQIWTQGIRSFVVTSGIKSTFY